LSSGVRSHLPIRPGDHLCALYFGERQRDDVLLPYINDGLTRGDKCLVTISSPEPGTVYHGIPHVGRYLATEQLAVRTSNDPRLAFGESSVDLLVDSWDATARSARTAGYPFIRFVADAASWVPQTPSRTDIHRYEAELDRYAGRHAQSILCLYDLARYGAGVVIDVLRVHPIILLSGLVLDNPYYRPPEEVQVTGG
jgi:hypothetical protein